MRLGGRYEIYKAIYGSRHGGLIGAMTLVSGVTAYAATGWQQNGSTYYYYDANGELHKGWLNTENGYYYLNLSTGKMTVGWEKINNKWYYFQGNGVMATGWVKDNGKYYYMLTDGTMHTGWVSIDNVFYYLGDSGAMATGLGEHGQWLVLLRPERWQVHGKQRAGDQGQLVHVRQRRQDGNRMAAG